MRMEYEYPDVVRVVSGICQCAPFSCIEALCASYLTTLGCVSALASIACAGTHPLVMHR